MEKFDVGVIGGGPGGYVAAIRAAQLGARVVLVEKDEVGGTCLLRGCIPTKAFLATADALVKASESEAFGVSVSGAKLNYDKALERKNTIVQRLVGGVHGLLKANKIEFVRGAATLLGDGWINVTLPQGQAKGECSKIIIATGSVAMRPAIFKVDGVNVITSDEALDLKEVPKSILIIGGGYVGCEFASMFRDFGAQVTLIELLPQLVPSEEREVAQLLKVQLKKRGINVLTNSKIVSLDVSSGKVTAKIESGETFEAEKALVSVGRAVASKGLGLEEADVDLDERGAPKVNEKMQTSIPEVYAIGDVLGTVMLAHVASAQGMVAAANALGGSREFSYKAIPNCVYTRPEIASVGMKESEAVEAGYEVATSKFQFTALGKAMIINDTTGFVKVVADKKTDKVLGVSMIGPEVTDLIHEMVLAVHLGATVGQIAEMIHAHPTLSEAIHEAIEGIHKQAIHMINR
ncbi:dihydrolipoyl dehydrogenase [Candidatus Poribacteria bacterium]|nr:dihydrolipoyl dehydrogenase [Candidatus Poribacteria bacterium]